MSDRLRRTSARARISAENAREQVLAGFTVYLAMEGKKLSGAAEDDRPCPQTTRAGITHEV